MPSAQQRQLKLLFSIIKEQIPTQLIERKHTSPLHLKNKIKLFITITQQKNCLISPQGKKKLQLPTHQKNTILLLYTISSNSYVSPCIFHIYPFSIAIPFPFKRGAEEDNVQNCNWKMSSTPTSKRTGQLSDLYAVMDKLRFHVSSSLLAASFFQPFHITNATSICPSEINGERVTLTVKHTHTRFKKKDIFI